MKYELKQLCVPKSYVQNGYLVDERMKKIWNIELNPAF